MVTHQSGFLFAKFHGAINDADESDDPSSPHPGISPDLVVVEDKFMAFSDSCKIIGSTKTTLTINQNQLVNRLRDVRVRSRLTKARIAMTLYMLQAILVDDDAQLAQKLN